MSDNERRLCDIPGPSSSEKSQEAPPVSTMKPFQYESREVLIAVMDPFLRFKIALHCPSMRQTEKKIPLKLDYLSFDKMCMIVNATRYELGIVRDFHPGHQITRVIEYYNRKGGCKHDLDRFGFPQKGDEPVVLPGNERLHRNEIATLKKEIRRGIQPVDRDPADELLRLENYVNGTTPPYDSLIQLTVGEHISKVPYTIKLPKALENLINRALGGRSGFLTIKKLEVAVENMPIFPKDLELKVQELSLAGPFDKILKTLEKFSVIHSDSFPLDLLEVKKWGRTDFNHSIVQNVKKFVWFDDYFDWPRETKDIFGLPKNSHLILKFSWWFNIDDLIKNWVENPRPVGTCLTLGMDREEDAKRRMRVVRQLEFEVIELDERSVSIPINHSTRINVSFEEMDPNRYESYHQPWMMRIEVISV